MAALTVADLNTDSARAITAPVLQHVQWHDEVFTLEGQFGLFDAFASAEKVLRARPGGHHLTREDDEEAWIRHLVRHL